MAQRLAKFFALSLAVCCTLVKADQTVVVDGQDQSIQYHTVQNGSANATWTKVDRSPDSCDTPQMLTSRLGDYMTFTFTGTGFQVVGTTGVKRGLIQFNLDGQNTTLKDRTAPKLACNSILYELQGLPNQQHTVMGTLVGKDINLSSGIVDGVFSVQRIRYTVPGGGGSTSVGAIAGGVVAGVLALVAAAVGYWWYRRRQQQQKQDGRRNETGAFIDSDDVPTHLRGKAAVSTTTSPGLVATPFEWNGPGSQYSHTPVRTPAALPEGITPSTETGTSNVPPSSYFPPALSSAGRTNTYSTSSMGDVKRDSNLVGTAGVASALGYSVAHPDSPETIMTSPRTSAYPGSGHRTSNAIDDTHLVDQIANRLADIMTTRTGGVGVLDHIVPPPVYTGYGGPEGPSGPQQQGPQPPTNAGSPGLAQSALPYPPSGDRTSAQLPYAQYSYQSPPPPPKNDFYPGSNRF